MKKGVGMFKIQNLKHKCRASIEGEMTIYNAAALKQSLDGALNDARELEINLSKVNEIDSAGIQLLMLAKKERAQHDRETTLTAHSNAVVDALEILGLAPYFGDPVVMTRNQGE
jgi:anti-anti-sigma factor